MTVLRERFDGALAWASSLHRAQVRKGTSIPYVSHLLAVAGMVLEAGGDEDAAIAAVLHDAVEDQGGGGTLEAIRERYGDRVASLVMECTDSDTQPKPPWKERKRRYLAHLHELSPAAKLIVIADKTHNARSILRDLYVQGDELWGRFNGGREGTLWYYGEIAKALEAGPQSELGRLVAAMQGAQ